MACPEKLLIIVATYNEIDCLPRLIHQIDELLPQADILVIDDGSPDGTGNWCEQATEKYPRLSVIHRDGKQGLGTAAIRGFTYALERDYTLVATLDADLSHSPQSLLEMVNMISSPKNKSVEVILGSRYIEGGRTEDWPLTRRIASRTVNGFARLMLGLKTKDNSGAFRVYRYSALQKLDLTELRSTDFAYLEEILWRLSKTNIKMVEYPIVFKNRKEGSSKTNPLLGVKVFWQIALMGLGRWK
ncbi:MAG: polyprenol monophosphomannose synthase [Mariniblastus sp.]